MENSDTIDRLLNSGRDLTEEEMIALFGKIPKKYKGRKIGNKRLFPISLARTAFNWTPSAFRPEAGSGTYNEELIPQPQKY